MNSSLPVLGEDGGGSQKRRGSAAQSERNEGNEVSRRPDGATLVDARRYLRGRKRKRVTPHRPRFQRRGHDDDGIAVTARSWSCRRVSALGGRGVTVLESKRRGVNTGEVSVRDRVTEPSEDSADSGPRRSVASLKAGAWSDAALVSGVVSGHSVALAALFDRYAGDVRNVLLTAYGSAFDVDDLTQETFLVVARRCSTLRDPLALRSFVISVAIRLARNEHRKRLVRRWVGLDTIPESTAATGAHDPCASEVVRSIHAALASLGVDSRIVFVLRRIEGYELTEGAAIVGCSLATFKRRLRRAEACFDALCRADPVLRELVTEVRP
jgi:RNA polymerase sigma-70 factor (ECF subfamily)